MKSFRYFLSLYFIFTGCAETVVNSSVASPPLTEQESSDPRHMRSLEDLTFLDMAMVDYLVRDTFDGNSNVCSIDKEKIFILPQQFRILMEQKYVQQLNIYRKKSVKEKTTFWPKECDQNCSCSAYIGFLEYMSKNGTKLTAVEKKAEKALHKKLLSESSNAKVCISQTTWFCRSKLMKELESNMQDH